MIGGQDHIIFGRMALWGLIFGIGYLIGDFLLHPYLGYWWKNIFYIETVLPGLLSSDAFTVQEVAAALESYGDPSFLEDPWNCCTGLHISRFDLMFGKLTLGTNGVWSIVHALLVNAGNITLFIWGSICFIAFFVSAVLAVGRAQEG